MRGAPFYCSRQTTNHPNKQLLTIFRELFPDRNTEFDGRDEELKVFIVDEFNKVLLQELLLRRSLHDRLLSRLAGTKNSETTRAVS